MQTDLLSPPVAPGAEVRTGVTLPVGSTAADPTPTGNAIGRFTVGTATLALTDSGDGVWYEVVATNTSSEEVRFSADFDYTIPEEEPEITITPAPLPTPEPAPVQE